MDEYIAGDEIWTYHACYDDLLASRTSSKPNGWAGFVIVREGEIVACVDL